MAKQIKQIRYFGEGDSRNYPASASQANLLNENYLQTCGVGRILQVSIHTLPGTRIHFNGDIKRTIYVGHSGVYQLDLTDTSAVLWGISFEEDDLEQLVNTGTNAGLIIDLLYEEDENSVAAGCGDEIETETIITSTGGKANIMVNSRIKNIHKNIWFGVDETVAPYVIGDTAEREYQSEFAQAVEAVHTMYEEHIAAITRPDGTITDPVLYEQYTECYHKKIKELFDRYKQHLDFSVDTDFCNSCIIVETGESGGETHALVDTFSGTRTDAGVSQHALNQFSDDVENAFDDITSTFEVNNGILSNNINTGNPDFNGNRG